MFNSEEEYNAAMQAEAEHDMEMAAQAAEAEAEQARIDSELNNLLECPFCGNKAGVHIEYIGDGDDNEFWSVSCDECDIYTLPDEKEAVIKLWNTRAK